MVMKLTFAELAADDVLRSSVIVVNCSRTIVVEGGRQEGNGRNLVKLK